jgi:hypothetical protein
LRFLFGLLSGIRTFSPPQNGLATPFNSPGSLWIPAKVSGERHAGSGDSENDSSERQKDLASLPIPAMPFSMTIGMIIAVCFLVAGAFAFTYLKKGSM